MAEAFERSWDAWLDDDVALCQVCKRPRNIDDGESTDDGLVCAECMKEPVQCEHCLSTYARSEFVDAKGIDELCGPCAFRRDMESA
jgi:hypothetical protein